MPRSVSLAPVYDRRYHPGVAMPDNEPEKPQETFDAVQAAAELAAALAGEPPASAEPGSSTAKTDRYTALLEDEVEALTAQLAQKEEALASAQAKSAEAAAEVDRVRVRIENSANETTERKRRAVIVSFLDVADGLDRAVAEMTKREAEPALLQGVQAVRSELRNVLRGHGATHRPSLGEPFDPALHEAIATSPATDEMPDGTISAVLSEGYELGGDTLRAARVVVAKTTHVS